MIARAITHSTCSLLSKGEHILDCTDCTAVRLGDVVSAQALTAHLYSVLGSFEPAFAIRWSNAISDCMAMRIEPIDLVDLNEKEVGSNETG